jgi:hypothetical protein
MSRLFRTGHALDGAPPERFRCPCQLLLGGISDEGCDRQAGAGYKRTKAADRRAAQNGPDRTFQVSAAGPHVARPNAHLGCVDRRDIVDVAQELGDAEQTQGDRHNLDAVIQMQTAEGEARNAGVYIRTDDAQQQTQHGHRHALQRRAPQSTRRG